MQTGTLLHIEMANQTTFRKEVSGKLNRAAKCSSDHGSLHATVQTTDSLGSVNRFEAVPCASVVVLGTNRPEGREALQTGLDQEKWAASRGADYARSSTAEHVNSQILGLSVLEEEACERIAHGVVEAETAAIEENLVDVGGADTAVDIAEAFIAYDDAHAVDRSSVMVRLVALILKLALQLHTDRRTTGQFRADSESADATMLRTYRILTVSNGCVAVTAPQAAMPPAMKALLRRGQRTNIAANLISGELGGSKDRHK